MWRWGHHQSLWGNDILYLLYHDRGGYTAQIYRGWFGVCHLFRGELPDCAGVWAIRSRFRGWHLLVSCLWARKIVWVFSCYLPLYHRVGRRDQMGRVSDRSVRQFRDDCREYQGCYSFVWATSRSFLGLNRRGWDLWEWKHYQIRFRWMRQICRSELWHRDYLDRSFGLEWHRYRWSLGWRDFLSLFHPGRIFLGRVATELSRWRYHRVFVPSGR